MSSLKYDTDLDNFFTDYYSKNPIILMILIILSCGLYFIYWIYGINRKFEKINLDCPDSRRGVIILLILPIILSPIILVFRYFLFPQFWIINRFIEIGGWGLITILSMKYLYDFCITFGNLTKTSGLTWYLFIYPGYYSLILLYFDFYYALPFIIFPIATIAAMQAILNRREDKYQRKIDTLAFETMSRNNQI